MPLKGDKDTSPDDEILDREASERVVAEEKYDTDENRVGIRFIEATDHSSSSQDFQHYGEKAILCRKYAISQVSIQWESIPKNVLIVKKHHEEEITSAMRRLANWLVKTYQMEIFVEPEVHKTEASEFQSMSRSNPGKGIDFCICLGGDGTLLHLNSLFQGNPIPPVASFAFGSLGFLTPFEFVDNRKIVSRIMKASETPIGVTLRMRITAQIFRRNSEFAEASYTVMNEVLVDRGSQPFLSKLELFIDDEQVTTVQADGLIISTPTGSTAYSMSAGGSMVAPTVPAILLTPICPHSLSFRPVITPDSCKIEIILSEDARSSASVSFDGRNAVSLHKGDKILIQSARSPLPSIKMEPADHEWFNSIRSKLHWNQREDQKPLNHL